MSFLSCSSRVVVKSKVVIPPAELMTTCPYKDFEGSTEKDLAMYFLHLQKQLDLCNLKQTEELLWFKELQESLNNETK